MPCAMRCPKTSSQVLVATPSSLLVLTLQQASSLRSLNLARSWVQSYCHEGKKAEQSCLTASSLTCDVSLQSALG